MNIDTFCAATDLTNLADAARRAEQQGFTGFAVPEITGDPFVHLAAAAMATERIILKTAIVVAFPRSPMVTAGASWALHANTGGRFALGLGTQVKGHNERRFSVPWSRPRQRMQEYVESLRAIWAAWETGERLSYAGEHYQFSLMTPEFSPPPTGKRRIPVYVAGVRPKMQEMVATYADGIRLHGFCTRRYMEEVAGPAIDTGLAAAGRSRAEFDICGGGFVATGPDEEAIQKKREWVRYRVAFYGSTRTYRPVMTLHGWDDLADKLHHMSKNDQWKEMAAQIPDEVVDEFVACALWDDLPDEIERRFGSISDTVEIDLTDCDPDRANDILGRVKAIDSKFTGHAAGW